MDVQISQILKPSNLINMQGPIKSKSKEEALRQWEENLKKKEYQLELKSKQLKQMSKEIQLQSELILKQKIDLQEKMDKYSKILEQIVNHHYPTHTNQNNQFTDRLFKSSSFNLNSCKNRSFRSNKESIVDCQVRVANLLNTIRSTSSFVKTPQQSYLAQQNSDYEEILFSKRNANTSNEIAQQQQQQQQQNENIYSKRNASSNSFDKVEINHEQELKQLEQNQKQFYQKVYEEMNRLKQRK